MSQNIILSLAITSTLLLTTKRVTDPMVRTWIACVLCFARSTSIYENGAFTLPFYPSYEFMFILVDIRNNLADLFWELHGYLYDIEQNTTIEAQFQVFAKNILYSILVLNFSIFRFFSSNIFLLMFKGK